VPGPPTDTDRSARGRPARDLLWCQQGLQSHLLRLGDAGLRRWFLAAVRHGFAEVGGSGLLGGAQQAHPQCVGGLRLAKAGGGRAGERVLAQGRALRIVRRRAGAGRVAGAWRRLDARVRQPRVLLPARGRWLLQQLLPLLDGGHDVPGEIVIAHGRGLAGRRMLGRDGAGEAAVQVGVSLLGDAGREEGRGVTHRRVGLRARLHRLEVGAVGGREQAVVGQAAVARLVHQALVGGGGGALGADGLEVAHLKAGALGGLEAGGAGAAGERVEVEALAEGRRAEALRLQARLRTVAGLAAAVADGVGLLQAVHAAQLRVRGDSSHPQEGRAPAKLPTPAPGSPPAGDVAAAPRALLPPSPGRRKAAAGTALPWRWWSGARLPSCCCCCSRAGTCT